MRRFLFGFAVATLIGCATTGGLQSRPLVDGSSQTYQAEYQKVLRATREAVVAAGLAIDQASQVDSTTWMIVAKKGSSAFSWGELVRVVVQQTAVTETTVRVVSAKKLATNVTAKGDYAQTIFSNVTLALK
jgi:hypothetical protein